MATLEKIRNKSVMLFIIIIVALLAFILGDFLTSGRSFFGNDGTMVKAGKVKVDHMEYQAAIQDQNGSGQDRDELQLSVLNGLLGEKLLQEQIDKLGIKITDNEISALMTEVPNRNTSQFISTLARAMGLPPTADGKMVYDAITNPGKYGLNQEALDQFAQQSFKQPTMLDVWAKMEGDVEKAMSQQIFMNLFANLYSANKLDAQASHDDMNVNTKIAYATKAFGTEPVDVTDDDLRAKWEELKPMYKLPDEMRGVDYIVVKIEPSAADLQEARTRVNEAAAALATTPGLEALANRPNFVSQQITDLVADLGRNNALMGTVNATNAEEGRVSPVRYTSNDYTYTLTKVQKIHPEVDLIKVSVALVDNKAMGDSLLAEINAGKTFAEVTDSLKTFAMDSVDVHLMKVPSQDNTIEAQLSAFCNEPKVKELVLNNPEGEAFVYTDEQNGQEFCYLINVIERSEPVDFADVSIIKYAVDPSNATISDLKSKLSSYVATNSNAEKFAANADTLYDVRSAFVNKRSPHIGDVTNSRTAVKWVMDAKAGQVSPVYEDNDHYLVVALKEVYKDKYLPFTADKERLTQLVTADKQAAKVINQYAGKANSVADYAKLMDAEVRVDSTSFDATTMIALNNAAVQGALAGAKVGTLVGPMQGNNQVVVFEVISRGDATERPVDDSDRNTFMRKFGVNSQDMFFNMLLGDRKIKDYTLDFVQSED